ncbi:MAG: UxaA family hydrolase [Candidatus Hodarchaeota archaeon]
MNPESDNVATALDHFKKEEEVKIDENLTVTLNKKIPLGHKFALKDIPKGDVVIKYGEVIGVARRDIKAGDWVHRQIRSPPMEGKKDE